MKKIMFLIIFLLCSPLYAGIYGDIEIGKDIETEKIYFTIMNLGYRFHFWHITSETYGGYFTYHELRSPFSETYSINQKLKLEGFFIKYSHYCNHRVVTSNSNDSFNPDLHEYYKPNPQALTIFSIGYEFELP